MKRRLLLPMLALMLACLAGGKNPDAPADARARQFENNLQLIQELVENSIRLAEEDDPLKRAGYCNGLIERFSSEIRSATENKNLARAEELGQYLHDLLAQGMAANLRAARERIPDTSILQKDLQDVRAQTERSIGPVEKQLERIAEGQDGAQRVLRLIRDARTELDQSLAAHARQSP